MISMIRVAGICISGSGWETLLYGSVSRRFQGCVDSDQIRSEPKAALKQGKSACLKLEGQGQKISIKKGAERNAAKVEVGSRRKHNSGLSVR